MLRYTICFILVVSFFSCSKKSTTSGHLVGSVSFSANGTSYAWAEQTGAEAFALSIFTITPGTYAFKATNDITFNALIVKEVFLTFQASSLITNTPFTLTNITKPDPFLIPHTIDVSVVAGNDLIHLYFASEIGDFATVTITRIHDQMADGNFIAKLSRASDLSVINITSGTFTNVKIYP